VNTYNSDQNCSTGSVHVILTFTMMTMTFFHDMILTNNFQKYNFQVQQSMQLWYIMDDILKDTEIH
jgi:hypothetical protein